jgi:hypothetical protein
MGLKQTEGLYLSTQNEALKSLKNVFNTPQKNKNKNTVTSENGLVR